MVEPLFRAGLNLWASRKKLSTNYDSGLVDGTNNQFYCKISIRTINHQAYAVGPNKKIAANQAAFDFLRFLYMNKYLDDNELASSCYTSLNIRDSIVTGTRQRSNDHRNNNQNNSNNNNASQQLKRGNDKNMDGGSSDGESDPNEFVPPEYRPASKEFFYPQAPPTLYANWIQMHKNRKADKAKRRAQNKKPRNNNVNNHTNGDVNRNGNANGYQNGNTASTDNFLDSMLENVSNIKNSIAKTSSSINIDLDDISDCQEIGGYTLENAKHLLGNFMLANRIEKTDYEFTEEGPPHKKIFTAQLTFNVFGREIRESARARSKQDASRICAFKIIRRLFQENLIEAFTTMISKRSLMKMNYIYAIDVSPKLQKLMQLNHEIVKSYQNQFNYQYTPGVLSIPNPLEQMVPEPGATPSYLFWCPPMENFDPWTGKKPMDPDFADKSFQEINHHLFENFTATLKNPKFHTILDERRKLPIFTIKERVMKLIEENPVLLIKGSTGCGKTTQVPQFILDTYLKQQNGSNCNIIVTQPRRISAISLAERVAAERVDVLHNSRGSVGYSVRFEHQYPRPYGSILFCTTGHLLRRLSTGLRGVSHIIIDEVHERDINTDCLLVLVRDLVRMGLGIKVIIMSATVGIQAFQKYFDNCHVLEIEGNLFPVQNYYLEDIIEKMRWKPKRLSYVEDSDVSDLTAFRFENENDNDHINKNIMEFNDTNDKQTYSNNTKNLIGVLKEGVVCYELISSILEYIYKIDENGHGAVLIFLPGWQAIFSLYHYLKQHPIFGDERKFCLLPLHSRLSTKDNSRVFDRMNIRKIILSTNIAETSITIDDIVFVIDSCLMKRKVYDPRTNVTSYIVDWVSKGNVQQRRGRAGRIRSGYFFALCSKQRFESFEDYKSPEILSSSLVEICLLIKYLGFTDVHHFISKLLDSPPENSVQQAISVLQNINAFDRKNLLTPLGKILIKVPIDPRLGKMLLQATILGIGSPAITIAASASISNELFDYTDLQSVGFELMKLDNKNFSDHWITFQVFNQFENSKKSYYDSSKLNYNALYQLRNARNQLIETLSMAGFPHNLYISKEQYSKYEIDTCLGLLVTAFYPNICAFAEGRRMITNERKIGLVHKNSVIYSYIWDRVLDKLQNIPSPLFVYAEKSKFENLISCKQMTMINFLQFLLFGVQKYEYLVCAERTLLLDGWLEVKIDHDLFDCVWIIRNEFERILTDVCHQPSLLTQDSHLKLTIFNTIRYMCSSQEVTFHLENKSDSSLMQSTAQVHANVDVPPPDQIQDAPKIQSPCSSKVPLPPQSMIQSPHPAQIPLPVQMAPITNQGDVPMKNETFPASQIPSVVPADQQ